MGDLTDVKVGDKLFVQGGYNEPRIEIVERITPSGRVIVTHYGEFNSNGRKRGESGWHSTSARPATEDDIARIYRHRLVRKLTDFRQWEKLSAHDLKTATEIIAKYKKD